MKIQKRQEIEFFGTKTGNANSIALGYATETKNFGEVAVGVMNKSTAAKDPNSPKGVCVDSDATLFSVGCGGSGERKNALEVKGDGSVLISGEDGDINVADKIKQALDTDASIELVKSADSDLQYTLMVNNESRGSINIPKDQFLKNVTYDTEAKQLVFTFVTLDEEEHVERISINDLKDVYTAGDGINIDDNVISADFSSVMTAISDEKTQRETTDNEIKSTLDTKADLNNAVTYKSTNISGLFDNDGNKQGSYGYRCIYIGCNNTTNYNNDSIHIGNDNNQLERGENTICVGNTNTFNYGSVCIGDHINSRFSNSIYIGSRIKTKEDTAGSYNTIIGSYDGLNVACTPVGFISIGFESRADKDGKVLYQIAAHHATDYNKDNYNLEETLTSDHDHKKYIYGVGNYDGTDPITANAKSLQEVLDDKIETISDYGSKSYLFKTGNEVIAAMMPTDIGNMSLVCGYLTDDGYDIDAGTAVSDQGMMITDSSKWLNVDIDGISKKDGKATEVFAADGTLFDLTTKADTTAIPTKVSQLTNDSNFATKNYVSDNIGAFKYSTITADLNSINGLFDSDTNRVRTEGANSVYIGFTDNADINTDAMGSVFIGKIDSYNTNYNVCIGNSINVNKDRSVLIGNDISSSNCDNILIGANISSSHMNSVIIGSGMTADVSDGYIGIGYDIKENTNAIYQIAGYGNPNIYNLEETLTYDNQHKKYIYGIGGYDGTNSDAEGVKSLQEVLADKANVSSIPNVSTKADLVDGKLKADQLPKLDNIAAATTTEDMITKFNALLTDLKAKGYMTADITA